MEVPEKKPSTNLKKKLNDRLTELCVLCNQVNHYEFNAASNPIAMYSVDWKGDIIDE